MSMIFDCRKAVVSGSVLPLKKTVGLHGCPLNGIFGFFPRFVAETIVEFVGEPLQIVTYPFDPVSVKTHRLIIETLEFFSLKALSRGFDENSKMRTAETFAC